MHAMQMPSDEFEKKAKGCAIITIAFILFWVAVGWLAFGR